jgi:hypothetical protein
MTGSSDSNLNPGHNLGVNAGLQPGEDDPFLHLHKMSTTAGLGSGDYVAINGTAIACILLGLGSAFVLFDYIAFLIIPVLGIISGIVAWKQISRSNGTQTGREVAIIGLLLSLGFGGFYTVSSVYGAFRNRSDEQQIVSTVHKLGELVHGGHYADAYALFDDDFKKKYSLQEFENSWRQHINANPYLVEVRSIEWNHLLTFDINAVDSSRQATGMMLLYCKPADPVRVHLSFKNEDGTWLIDQFPEVFPQDVKKETIGPPKPK